VIGISWPYCNQLTNSCLYCDGLCVSENLTTFWQLTIVLVMPYHHAEWWYQFHNKLRGLWWIVRIWESDNLFTIDYRQLSAWWQIHDILSGIFFGPSTVFQCVALWVGLNIITSSQTAAWLMIDCENPRIRQFINNWL
jgi:hypothetical protein